jgi:curved DNA-binding protein CbpA
MRAGRDFSGLDPYETLGVTREAGIHEIRKAYRRKVRESHPDLHPDNPRLATRMRDLNLAARILLDPAMRAAYDRFKASGQSAEAKTWWERGAADDRCEWVEPPTEPRPRSVPAGARGFLREVRGSVARAFANVDAELLALPPRGRLLLGSVGVGVALLLLAAAQPRIGGERMQPVSVSPAVLTP